MIQNIPNRFNKMAVYRQPSSPTPPTPEPVITSGLIWYMDFSNGLVQPNSQITGTNSDSNILEILTDQQMGTYVHNGTENVADIQWTDSQQYLANLVSGTDPFTISFWMRVNTWYNDLAVINFRGGYDGAPGVTIYGDGWNTGMITSPKINCRVGWNFWTLTQTDAAFDNNWNLWTYTRDSNGANWYLNGELDYHTDQIEIEYPDQVPPQQADVTAGRDIQIVPVGFDITKYRIYNRALTSTQVNALYTNKA